MPRKAGRRVLTMIWAIFALLTGTAILAVLWPLSRAPVETDARGLDVAFYRAQTAEIERDAARGAIGAEEAEVARTEAARRLVTARQRTDEDVRGSSKWAVLLASLGVLAFIPALALGLYTRIGAPDMPDEPLEARLQAAPANMDMATAIAKIENHLAKEPDDGKGWSVLAPIYIRLNRFEDAKKAYENQIHLLGPSADRYAGLGQAEMGIGGGSVTGDARKAFEEAVKLDPKSPAPNFYLGLAAEQSGDKAKAGDIWRKLVSASPPDAPWLPTVQNHLAALEGREAAPSAGAAAGPVAGMPKDQQAMIHTMVDRLATRLKTNGNDVEGWLRLIRAYRVLDEQDKAKLALADAHKALASDVTATKRVDDLAHELGLES